MSPPRNSKPTSQRKSAYQRMARDAITPYSRGPNTQRKYTALRQLKSALGVEPKYFDVEVGAAIASGVSFATLTPQLRNPRVLLGDDVFNRNGKKITLNRVMFRGSIFTTPTTLGASASPCSVVRLFLWRNDQFGSPNDFVGMADGTAYANAAVALGGFQSPNANGYGKIVDDQTFVLEPTAAVNNASATTASTVAKECPVVLSYSPKKPMTLNYQAASVTADPDKWFTIFGNCDATTFSPSLNGVMRFYYTDA